MPSKKIMRPALYAGKGAKGFLEAEKKGEIVYGKTDRKPRFEIDDSKSTVRNPKDLTASKQGIPLGTLMAHPDLYKNYPELKDIKIIFQDGNLEEGADVGGGFDPKTKTITVRRPTDIEILQDPGVFRKTIIHELQHLIQNKEGFAYSDPKSLFDYWDRPGEQEAYTAEARIDLSTEDRKKYGHDQSLYSDSKRDIVPQTFFSSHEEIEAAVKKELDRRLKEKEQMPTGFDHYTTTTSPVYPRKNVIGVIYPDDSNTVSR